MSVSKILKSALCLGISVGGLSIHAASVEPIPESEITVLEIEQVVPLDIVLFKPEPDMPLAGQVGYNGIEGTDIEYQLFDKNGALVWSDFQEIPSDANSDGRYDFEFTDIDLKGDFELRISVYNQYGDLMGDESRMLAFEIGELRLDIKDLTVLSTPDKLKVGFIFENDKVSRKVQPKVEIYHGDHSHLLVKEVKTEEVGIGGKQKKRFTLDIEKDFAPGLYLLEASVITPDGKAVTGSLQSSFFRKGNYVKMTEYEFLLDNYEEEKKGGFWFKGRILEVSEEAVEAILVLRDGTTILLEKNLPLNINRNGRFTGNFSFTFPEFISQFTGTLKIKKGGKILWEEVLESPVFEAAAVAKVVISVEEGAEELIIDKKEEEKKSIPIYMYTLAIVFFAFLALLFVLRSAKKQTFIWFLLLSLGGMGIGSSLAAVEDFSVYWSHPVKGWGFTQNSSDFSKMHIEGAIFDTLTGNGFFDVDPTEVRINFTDSSDVKREYVIPLGDIDFTDNRSYAVTTDLSSGYDELSMLDPGSLIVQLLFKKFDSVSSTAKWYGTRAQDFSIILDNTAPETLNFGYSGQSITKNKTQLTVTCNDAGIGCFNKDKIVSVLDSNKGIGLLTFDTYDVKGNFCRDGANCDDAGAKGFEICDAVGNCTDAADTTKEIEIDWYDPIAPKIGELNVWEKLVTSAAVNMKAFDGKALEFKYDDPNTIDKDASENNGKFDDHACGDGTGAFFEEAGICKQRIVACVKDTTNYSIRGETDLLNSPTICASSCPSGYVLDSTYCVRECSDDRFYPTAMCFGYDSDSDGNGDSFCLDGACPITP